MDPTVGTPSEWSAAAYPAGFPAAGDPPGAAMESRSDAPAQRSCGPRLPPQCSTS